MSAPKRYLVVAPSWVGDLVMAQPLLSLLKQRSPDCVIDVFAPDWVLPLVQRMPEVAEAIASPFAHKEVGLPARWRIARSLSKKRYDTAIVLPNSFKSALVPWFARIPERIGYVGETRYGIINRTRKLNKAKVARLVDRFAALAFPSGSPPASGSVPNPYLLVDAKRRRTVIARLGLNLARPVACLCPGAEYGPAKRWPAEYFAQLAQRLSRDGMAVWLVGSKRDAPITAQIKQLSGMDLKDLAGATRLDEAVDVLSCATIVISNDSGLMHIAAAVQRPLIALFGSSSPDYTPPLSAQAKILRIPIECSPCFERTCPLQHFNCMMQLTPDRVYQHVQTIIHTVL